jgi:hypothetical protein
LGCLIYLTMSYFSLEIIFSILVLLISYFMTSLALLHGYIPGGVKHILEKNGEEKDVVNFLRVFGISFLVASFFSGLMFYMFIFPSYRLI